MKANLIALLAGIIFGVGLSLSHMINPNKVLDFLDITGSFDPSLVFVMIGALSVSVVTFKWVLKRPAPILADTFHVPPKRAIEKRLILGAAIFGIGWGIGGYCPGPAVAGLGLFSLESVVMIIAIYLGMVTYQRIFERTKTDSTQEDE